MVDVLDSPKPPNVSGSQPATRFSAHAARSTIQTVEQQYFQALRFEFQQIQDEYDRVPPEGDLTDEGFGSSTNVNWGTLAARVDETIEPLWNLAMGGDSFLKFKTSVTGQPTVVTQLDILRDEHRNMMLEWDDFGDEMSSMIFNRVLFGLGVFYFPKPHGWHFSSLHPASLIYAPGSSQNINEHSWVALRTRFDVPELLQVIQKRDAAQKLGWNVSAVRKAIEHFGDESSRQVMSDVLVDNEMPNELRYQHAHNTHIDGYIFLVREWDNTITEHLLVPHDEVGYIYTKSGKYKQFSDAILLFPHALGASVLDKVRGYGSKTLPFHDTINRVSNHEIDVATLAGSLILQARDVNSLDRMEEIRMGALTVLPPDFEAQQQAFSDPGSALREVKADMRRQLSGVNASFGGRTDLGTHEKTARETVLTYQDSNQIQTFAVARFRKQLDRFARVLWRRTVEVAKSASVKGPGDEEAREMLRAAEARGFIPEILGVITSATYNTAAGDGNRVNTILALDSIRGDMPLWSTSGQRAFARRYASAALDDENFVAALFADQEQATGIAGLEESRQVSQAQVENGILESSTTGVAVRADDDHFIHLATHLEFFQQKQALLASQQADPRNVLRLATRMLEHVGPHTQAASQAIAATPQGPTREMLSDQFSQILEGFSQVENTRRQLEQNIEAEAKAQQQAQQRQVEEALTIAQNPGPKEQRELAMLDARFSFEQAQHEQALRHAEEKHQLELRDLAGRVPDSTSS